MSSAPAAATHPSQQALVTVTADSYDMSAVVAPGKESAEVHIELNTFTSGEDRDLEAGPDENGKDGAALEPNPFAVASMPDYIRMSFRRKALGLLCLNQICILLIATAVRYIDPVWSLVRQHQFIPALCILFVLYGLACMVLAKDKHPYNYYAFLLFTVSMGLFMGSADRVFESHANFQLMLYITGSTVLMTLLCTTKLACNQGEPYSHVHAAILGWFVVFIVGLVVQLTPAHLGVPGHFASTQLITLAVVVWFAYDAAKVEQRLTPDDFLLAVISFYADLVIVIGCYCCAAIFCGDSGN